MLARRCIAFVVALAFLLLSAADVRSGRAARADHRGSRHDGARRADRRRSRELLSRPATDAAAAARAHGRQSTEDRLFDSGACRGRFPRTSSGAPGFGARTARALCRRDLSGRHRPFGAARRVAGRSVCARGLSFADRGLFDATVFGIARAEPLGASSTRSAIDRPAVWPRRPQHRCRVADGRRLRADRRHRLRPLRTACRVEAVQCRRPVRRRRLRAGPFDGHQPDRPRRSAAEQL